MANKETRILKDDTLENLRQKSNEISLHLGDNEQLNSNLSDKTYNFVDVAAGSSIFTGQSDGAKTVRFEVSPSVTVDNTGGYVILKNSPSIPSAFIVDAVIYQGTSGSPTWNGLISSITSDKILVRNTAGTFSSSADLKVGASQTIANANVIRLIGEAFPKGILRVYKNSVEMTQGVTATGFHVANHAGTIILSNNPTLTNFIEGEVVYQNSTQLATQSLVESTSNWYGVILKSTSTQLLIKTWSDVNSSFSTSQVIRVLGYGTTIAAADHSGLTSHDTTIGNTIELNTPATLNDDIKIFSMDAVAGLNELQHDVGVTENLTTVATDLTSAVNEIEAVFDASTHEITAGTNEFDVTSGTFNLDSSGIINLDTNSGAVNVKVGGAQYGAIENTSGNILVKSGTTTMLTGAGASATFAQDVTVNRDVDIDRNLNVDGTAELNSTLGVDGNFRVGENNTSKFDVAAATGNTQIDGTLEVDGTAGIDGDLRVGSNKFNVTASSGDTQIDGTLEVDGTAGVDGNFRVGSSGGDKFNVTAVDGNTQIDGTLNVDSTTTLNGTTIDGDLDLNGSVDVSTNATIHGVLDVDGVSNLDVVDIDGAVDMALTLQVDGNTTIGGVVDIGQLNAKFTNRNNVKLALNELHDEMGNAVITGTGTAADGLTNLTAAINSIDAEIGTVASYEGGTYGSTTISGVLTSLQTGMINNDTDITNLFADVGTLSLIDNLPTDYTYTITDLTTATNTMSQFIGNTSIANIGTTDTVTGALQKLHAEIGDSVLTVFAATDVSGALRELETEKVYLTSSSQQEIASKLGLTGNVTFKDGGTNNDTMTFNSGTTLDLSNASLLLPGNASNVNIFSTSFLEVDGNVQIQGFSVDRQHVATIVDKSDVRFQWNENYADGTSATKPSRAWQIQGLNDSSASHTTDVVTFYNAKDLITSNAESGINVTWDATNENFDFNVNDPTVQLSGDVVGSAVMTNLGSINISTTIQPNSVALGTDTTGNYIKTLTGTQYQVTVSPASHSEGKDATLSIPTDFRMPGTARVLSTTQSSLSSATDGALVVDGGVSIAKNLYVGGDLIVKGSEVKLEVTTLEVEDTLILAGNNLSSEPSSGGFGIETGPITSPSGVASGVTGAHSIVYNYGTDRWEADGSLILSSATLGSPNIEGSAYEANDNLNFVASTGLTLVTGKSGSTHTVTYTNSDRGSSQAIFKNITANAGGTATANINNDTLNLLGGTALGSVRSGDSITFNHDNIGLSSGSAVDDGTYVQSIGVNAQGHITSVVSGDFDDYYMRNWALFVNGSNVDTITQGERVGFDEGAGIDLAFDGNDITITHQDTSTFGGYTSTGDSSPTTMSFVRDIALGVDTFGHVTSGSATQGTFTLGDGVTTITATAAGISLTGDNTWSANQTAASTFNIAHADTSSQASVDNTGNNVIQDITLDTFGHITSLVSKDITTVTNAAKLYTTGTNSVGPYYLSMAGAYGNAYQDHYTDANLSYNASTNVLSAVTFSGALSGNASTASHAAKVQSTYTNASTTMYINGTPTLGTASKDMYHTNAIYMTPSNDYLYAARFVGPLTGAVTGNASTSTQVYVTSTASNTDYRLIFGENNDGGNGYESLYKDSGASLYYNPSTNRLYAEHIQGEGSLITNINYGNIYNPPTIGNGQIDGRTSGLGLSGTMDATANQSGNTTFTVTSNATTASTASTIAYRDGSGDIHARLFRSEYDSTNASIGYIMTQVDTVSNNYIRPSTAAQIRSFLNVENGSTADQNCFSSIPIYSAGPTHVGTASADSTADSFSMFSGTGITLSTGGDNVTITNTAPNVTTNLSTSTATTSVTINSSDGTNASIGEATASAAGVMSVAHHNKLDGIASGANAYSLPTYPANMNQYVRSTDNVHFEGLMVGQTSAATANTIRCTGDVVAYYSSDERLKENIKVLENGLDKVCQLRGVEFDWNDKQDVYEGHDIGVIAQDVEKVAPELVETRKHDGYKAVKYEKLTALLIEAVKELKDENKELRSMIEDLKSINS